MCPEPNRSREGDPPEIADPSADLRAWTHQREQIDEWRAVQTRNRLGARGWLLSWSRETSKRWAARLSRPEFPRTILRTGRDRIEAIDRAIRASTRLLEARSKLAPTNRIAPLPDDPGELD